MTWRVAARVGAGLSWCATGGAAGLAAAGAAAAATWGAASAWGVPGAGLVAGANATMTSLWVAGSMVAMVAAKPWRLNRIWCWVPAESVAIVGVTPSFTAPPPSISMTVTPRGSDCSATSTSVPGAGTG